MQVLRPSAVSAIAKCAFQDVARVVCATGLDDHYGIPVSFIQLADANLVLAEAILRRPTNMLDFLEECLPAVQELVISQLHSAPGQQQQLVDPSRMQQHPTVKENVHLRLHSLPQALDPDTTSSPSSCSPAISGIGSRHLGKLISVTGTVVRTGAVKMFEAAQLHECTRCKERFLLKCYLEQGGAPQMPEECPRRSKPCAGTNFRRVPDVQVFTAYQEVRVQEKMQCLAMGALPCSITVLLQDELADTCRAGDDVSVVGVVLPQWRALVPGGRCDAELLLCCCHLAVAGVHQTTVELSPEMEADFQAFWLAHTSCVLTGRNKILAGFCPQVCGMFLVKLATMLALVGGVQRVDETGCAVRGEVHLLLIGDPGTGKSQIMKFASRVSHRAVSASGRASTAAGLTAVAVKDSGAWVLEAGALVLADGGLCCIDEFEGIKEADRAALHEAMEQQTVHVAKAGLVATLSTRTTVIAATNPRPSHKPNQPLASMTHISGPLLSRFDLLLVLADTRNPHWDRAVSQQILDNHTVAPPEPAFSDGSYPAPSHSAPASSCSTSGGGEAGQGGWTIDVLQRYLLWVRRTFQPVMTTEAEVVLKAYYSALRRSAERNPARTTIRILESLVRVAQAHARLTAQHQVTQRDAIAAVLVIDASQNVLFMTGGADSAIHSEFADDPEAEYRQLEARVMAELQLGPRSLAAPSAGSWELGDSRRS